MEPSVQLYLQHPPPSTLLPFLPISIPLPTMLVMNSLTLSLVAVASTLLLSSSSALPLNEVDITKALTKRQLGIKPSSEEPGTKWRRDWTDTSLKAPIEFDAIAGSGCSYTINFKRDVRDKKYLLWYESLTGINEGETSQDETPSSLGYVGSVDGEGRQVYSAFIENACSRFYSDRRRPRAFNIYFTQEDVAVANYISPKFN